MALKKSGVALGLAALVAMGSATLLLNQHHMPCEQRAPLTIMATLAAFVIAFCLRQFAAEQRSGSIPAASKYALLAALVLAAACLFLDARFVLQYRAICNAPLPVMNIAP